MKKHVELRVASLSAVMAGTDAQTAGWMGEAEQVRLAAMGSPMRRRQFIAGHWLARELAAEFTCTRPHDWLLLASATGAPELHWRGSQAMPSIHVSLSHSSEAVAAAVAWFPVGLDLESGDRARDWLALANYVFAAEECAQLRQAPEADREEVFHRFWTLKEASGKRDGTGLLLSEAPKQRACECDKHEAVAITWQFDRQCVALVGQRDMQISAHGIPPEAQRRFWQFDASRGAVEAPLTTGEGLG